jgi:hypothetical protein
MIGGRHRLRIHSGDGLRRRPSARVEARSEGVESDSAPCAAAVAAAPRRGWMRPAAPGDWTTTSFNHGPQPTGPAPHVAPRDQAPAPRSTRGRTRPRSSPNACDPRSRVDYHPSTTYPSAPSAGLNVSSPQRRARRRPPAVSRASVSEPSPGSPPGTPSPVSWFSPSPRYRQGGSWGLARYFMSDLTPAISRI